jgi:hypothetical protein
MWPDVRSVTSGAQVPTLAKIFRKNSCVALTTGSRNLPTHREVRVGSKTDRLPGKTWETGVLTGRRDGADRGVKESVDSAGNGGETEARSTAPRRRATGDENRALREGPLELILRGALLNACALRFAASRLGGESGSSHVRSLPEPSRQSTCRRGSCGTSPEPQHRCGANGAFFDYLVMRIGAFNFSLLQGW